MSIKTYCRSNTRTWKFTFQPLGFHLACLYLAPTSTNLVKQNTPPTSHPGRGPCDPSTDPLASKNGSETAPLVRCSENATYPPGLWPKSKTLKASGLKLQASRVGDPRELPTDDSGARKYPAPFHWLSAKFQLCAGSSNKFGRKPVGFSWECMHVKSSFSFPETVSAAMASGHGTASIRKPETTHQPGLALATSL